MKEIGAYEARTHLPRLIEQAQAGERFAITRHGRPVAALVPVAGRSREEIRAAIERLRAFQAKHALGGVSVGEMVQEGRSY